jgi:uncharacterized membrane protein YkvA (DUF1232 family)
MWNFGSVRCHTGAMNFFKESISFIKNVANDPRIPEADKKILLVLVALIVSPFDLIPDWIPVFGQLDDVVILAVVLDYFFNHLDQEILLSHYPWGMKSFVRLRKTARFVAMLTPGWVKTRVWEFKPSIYHK